MKRNDIRYYVHAIKELREMAVKNVAVKDELYASIMIDINQCLTFCNQHIEMNKRRTGNDN